MAFSTGFTMLGYVCARIQCLDFEFYGVARQPAQRLVPLQPRFETCSPLRTPLQI